MKRIIMWIVILGIAGGLTACGDEGSGRDAEKKENPASEAAVQKSGSGQRDAKKDRETSYASQSAGTGEHPLYQ